MAIQPPVEIGFRPDRTPTEASAPIMAYVLFVDIVGFTRMPMDRQRAAVRELQEVVFSSAPYAEAAAENRVLCRPTGDGMALVFFNSLLTAARCAIEVSGELRERTRIRMGIHCGHVYRVTDRQGNPDVIGDGINTAQRVMDCGDSGHILLSREAAGLLTSLEEWRSWVHAAGECEVKHGQIVALFNLHSGRIGSRSTPRKVQAYRWSRIHASRHARLLKRAVAAALLTGLMVRFAPAMAPAVGASAKAAWRTLFRADPEKRLAEARACQDRERWEESLEIAGAVLKTDSATPDQRAEASLWALGARLRLPGMPGAKEAWAEARRLADGLPKDHWIRRALVCEAALARARSAVAAEEWATVSRIADRVRLSASSPELASQKAEAYYLLAMALHETGGAGQRTLALANEFRRFKADVLDRRHPNHWTEARFAVIAEGIRVPRESTGRSRVSSRDASDGYVDEVRRLYQAGDLKALDRELSRLDRFRRKLSSEDIVEVQLISLAARLNEADNLARAGKQWERVSRLARTALAGADALAGDGRDDQVQPERARAYYLLARALTETGRRTEAREAIQGFRSRCRSIIESDPYNAWVQGITEIEQGLIGVADDIAPAPESSSDSNDGAPNTDAAQPRFGDVSRSNPHQDLRTA